MLTSIHSFCVRIVSTGGIHSINEIAQPPEDFTV